MADLSSLGQDEVNWLPGSEKSAPYQVSWERPTHLSALDFIDLEVDVIFRGMRAVLCPVVDFDLVIEACLLFQPVVRHLACDWP